MRRRLSCELLGAVCEFSGKLGGGFWELSGSLWEPLGPPGSCLGFPGILWEFLGAFWTSLAASKSLWELLEIYLKDPEVSGSCQRSWGEANETWLSNKKESIFIFEYDFHINAIWKSIFLHLLIPKFGCQKYFLSAAWRAIRTSTR